MVDEPYHQIVISTDFGKEKITGNSSLAEVCVEVLHGVLNRDLCQIELFGFIKKQKKSLNFRIILIY
jgi:hypothetical protein